jgi:HK97 family phage prohead protease
VNGFGGIGMETRIYHPKVRPSGRTIKDTIYCDLRVQTERDFWERFQQGCFRDSIKTGATIVSFLDHYSGQPLASTVDGTLQIEDHENQVDFTIHLPANALGDEVLELAERGDVVGFLIGFTCTRDRWEQNKRFIMVRTVEQAELNEISPLSRHYPKWWGRLSGREFFKFIRDNP